MVRRPDDAGGYVILRQRLGLLMLLWLLAGTSPAGEAASWSPAQYRDALTQLGAAIDAGDYGRLQAQATRIATATIAWPSGVLPGDPTLVDLAKRQAVAPLRQRLQALDSELAELGAPQTAGVAIDRAALERLAEREAAAGAMLRQGGGTSGNPFAPEHLPPTIGERLAAVGEWLVDRLRALFGWIRDWFKSESKESSGSGSTVVTLTLILVGALLVVGAVLALLAWRRREPPVAMASAVSVPAAADADPRSRAADEWVGHAQELMRLGRHREAIRAWYHALLVDCWSRGLLHHRVGRTNWEYALTLPASAAWRSHFQDLTHRFDQAWYGGRVESDESQAFASEAEQVLSELRAQRSAA